MVALFEEYIWSKRLASVLSDYHSGNLKGNRVVLQFLIKLPDACWDINFTTVINVNVNPVFKPHTPHNTPIKKLKLRFEYSRASSVWQHGRTRRCKVKMDGQHKLSKCTWKTSIVEDLIYRRDTDTCIGDTSECKVYLCSALASWLSFWVRWYVRLWYGEEMCLSFISSLELEGNNQNKVIKYVSLSSNIITVC